MSATLTESEKSAVRRHLGFPETEAVSVYAMGMVIPMQGMFLVDSAMTHLTEAGASRTRDLLGVLDGLEKKMLKAACCLTVERIGEIQMRPSTGAQGTDLIEREYIRWAKRLSDCLGVPYYPYAEKFSGGCNIRVKR
jgi:hypothetical protein